MSVAGGRRQQEPGAHGRGHVQPVEQEADATLPLPQHERVMLHLQAGLLVIRQSLVLAPLHRRLQHSTRCSASHLVTPPLALLHSFHAPSHSTRPRLLATNPRCQGSPSASTPFPARGPARSPPSSPRQRQVTPGPPSPLPVTSGTQPMSGDPPPPPPSP